MSFFKKDFFMSLSNGQKWCFNFSKNTSPFADLLVQTMTLKNDNSCKGSKLIFTADTNNEICCQFINNDISNLSSKPWISIKTELIDLRVSNDLSCAICNIGQNSSQIHNVLKASYTLFPIYYKEINYGGLPLHAALLESNDFGVVLAASGNIGKSTCCNRIPKPWQALCDDETLIVNTNYNSYNAHPFPTWSNFFFNKPKRSWDVQQYVPLKAIFFLKQAKVDEAIPLQQGEAAIRIYYSSQQVIGRFYPYLSDSDSALLKKQVFENSCSLSKAVPSFTLKVNLHGKFWEEIDMSLIDK